MKQTTKPKGWDRFYITYNPHFMEYHANREASHCTAYSNRSKRAVQEWIAKHGQPVELSIFEFE